MPTTTIPALPCVSLEESLAFWQAVGFTVAYKQRAPNPYAVIRSDDYELHLFGLKELKPENNFSTCLVIVPEVEQLHGIFVTQLRTLLGKIPIKGFPRISRMRPGQTRFTLTDVAGNSIIYIKRGVEDAAAAEEYKQPGQTPLQQALNTAARLRDFHTDDAAAAKVLDLALKRHAPVASLEYARVLAARIELAIALDDRERAVQLQSRLAQLPISDADRQLLQQEQPATIAE